MTLSSDSRIAVVCRGGPENGPFSAAAFTVLNKGLKQNGLKVSGLYAVSGSVTTALLGAIGEEEKLCRIWSNMTPKDIVGKLSKFKTIRNFQGGTSILPGTHLERLIRKNFGKEEVEKFFSPEAIMAKIGATDMLKRKLIVFSNRNPKHKEWIYEGIMGSKALIPFFSPRFVYDPVESELTDQTEFSALVLLDGAYKGSLLLPEMAKDGYDLVFVIDLNNVEPAKVDMNERFFWLNILKDSFHILINTLDASRLKQLYRVNEEIIIRDEVEAIKMELAKARENLPREHASRLNIVLSRLNFLTRRMNAGHLKLENKRITKVCIVSDWAHAVPFNFTKFSHNEIIHIMQAGRCSAIRVLEDLGLSVKGLQDPNAIFETP